MEKPDTHLPEKRKAPSGRLAAWPFEAVPIPS